MGLVAIRSRHYLFCRTQTPRADSFGVRQHVRVGRTVQLFELQLQNVIHASASCCVRAHSHAFIGPASEGLKAADMLSADVLPCARAHAFRTVRILSEDEMRRLAGRRRHIEVPHVKEGA